MMTETRQSRTHVLHYEHHHRRRPRRRHHTLDNATLDQFNFICVPLRRDESRMDSSSSYTNLTMTQPTRVSVSTTTTRLPTTFISSEPRRVRFQFNENNHHRNRMDLNINRHTRSYDDVRAPETNSRHRVEFRIPIQRDHNPWLNVDYSTSPSPAKTRSLTSQKIDIKHSTTNSMRVQGIAPFVQAEIHSHSPSTNGSDKTQSQWYRQMYGHLHKSPERRQDQEQNPYKPTYTFPEEFNGDSDHMEDYIRKTASQTIEKDNNRMNSMSSVRPLTSNLKAQRTAAKRSNGHIEKVTRFEDDYSPPIERPRSNNDGSIGMSSPMNTNSPSNSTPTPTSDNEQKLVYKRILRGGDIPSNGLQKAPPNNREKPSNGNAEQQTRISQHRFVDTNRQQQPEPKSQIRNNLQPISKALALHSFYAQTSRELSFKKGDILFVLRRINDDWLEGELEGSVGIFPLNHVELFPADTHEQEDEQENGHDIQGEAIVKYDFIPQKTFELQLRKGDKVVLLRRLDENWYEGRLNHIEGIFPTAYVETLREPPEIFSPKSPSNESVQPTKQLTPESEKSDASSLSLRKCQVLYDYTPQNPDELEIHVGDIINIIEMCDDGWYCGIMEKSNHKPKLEFGTFPGNYVQLLPIEKMI